MTKQTAEDLKEKTKTIFSFCLSLFLFLRCWTDFSSQAVLQCASLLPVQLTHWAEGAYFTCMSNSVTPPGNQTSTALRQGTSAASSSLPWVWVFFLFLFCTVFCHLIDRLQWQQVLSMVYIDSGAVKKCFISLTFSVPFLGAAISVSYADRHIHSILK